MTIIDTPAAPAARRAAPAPAPQRRAHPRLSAGRPFVYLIALAAAASYVVPLYFLVNTALKTSDGFLADPTGVTRTLAFDNFVKAWEQGNFGVYFVNSLLYTLIAATISTVGTLLLAFPVARGYLHGSRRFWPAVFVVSLFLPNALTAQFQLMLKLGLYDNRLGYILLMSGTMGVGPLLVMGYLRSLPKELDEAAAIDGCGYFRYLFTFVAPLIRPVLVTVFVLHAIGTWNDIVLATIYLADPAKWPVTVGLFSFKGQYSSDWALLSAAVLLVAMPLVLLFAWLQKYLVSGITQGALKS
ncbi:sugar ABC transporter permease [Nonomuraea sp. TT08I-71]|nr:sugar ABC transporter permease [Nonomuraea sp. TT08I-71]